MMINLRTIWAIATLLLTAACTGGGGGSGAAAPAAERWAALTQTQMDAHRAGDDAAFQARMAILDSQNVRANRAVPIAEAENPHILFARWKRRLETEAPGDPTHWRQDVEESIELDQTRWADLGEDAYEMLLLHASKGM